MLDLQVTARALGGELLGENRRYTGVSIDSRQMRAGDLLVAIRGERLDGHQFVAEALASGAAAAIVDRAAVGQIQARPLIVVDDTRRALGQLAGYWRDQWAGVLIGVTGSNGKTTVKEMVAAILRVHAGGEAVIATAGNLNNDIGMPLMLLRMTSQHRYAVIEMGMNHLGEIAYLTQIAKPSLAVINNAGTAHIGEVGSRERIAQAKGEIFQGLRADGVAVLNADDGFAPYWRGLIATKKVVDFAIDAGAQVKGRVEALEPLVRLSITHADRSVTIDVPALGRHNAMNALCAASVAIALGVPLEAIRTGLATYEPVKGRLQRKIGSSGAAIIDDTYNANPDSVKAAIDVLAGCKGMRVLVLGDLGELGNLSASLHREVGQAAAAAGLDRLYTLGEMSAGAAEAFGAGARHFSRIEDLIPVVRADAGSQTTVLVKGSRFMRMERVVEALVAQKADAAEAHH